MSHSEQDAEMSSAPDTLERVADLWWEDGNLIIEAGRKRFKVYKGLLASRSPVFADMLSVPQPEDSEKFDGCPVVRLLDDGDEVEHFLRALFDYASFSYEPTGASKPRQISCSAVVAVLQLSHKYNIEHLRRRAILRLMSYFPTTLEAFLNRESHSSISIDPDNINHILGVVSAARTAEAPWLLPAGFYVLACRWSPVRSITTVFGDDRTAADTYIVGSMAQVHAHLRTLKFLSYDNDRPNCTSLTQCSKERLRRLTAIGFWDNGGNTSTWSDPLGVWEEGD